MDGIERQVDEIVPILEGALSPEQLRVRAEILQQHRQLGTLPRMPQPSGDDSSDGIGEDESSKQD